LRLRLGPNSVTRRRLDGKKHRYDYNQQQRDKHAGNSRLKTGAQIH
jgi:hypothetical protein